MLDDSSDINRKLHIVLQVREKLRQIKIRRHPRQYDSLGSGKDIAHGIGRQHNAARKEQVLGLRDAALERNRPKPRVSHTRDGDARLSKRVGKDHAIKVNSIEICVQDHVVTSEHSEPLLA